MKRRALRFLVMANIVAGGIAMAGELSWGNWNEAKRPAAETGGIIPANDPLCTIYLMKEGDPNPLQTVGMNSGPGYWYAAVVTTGGFNVYVYMTYNAGPGYYYQTSLYAVPPMPQPIDMHTYVVTAPEENDWIPIPEPTTVSLMGAGLALLCATRLRRKR